MRLSDVIIITLAVGLFFGVFYGMVTDNKMIDYYDDNVKMNLSARVDEIKDESSPFYMLQQAITGQENASQSNAITVQTELEQASKNEIGLLSIPGAVLSGMKTVFNVFRVKWFNTFVAGIEQIFGLMPGDLGFMITLGTIIFWVIIFLFIGAVLRWKS